MNVPERAVEIRVVVRIFAQIVVKEAVVLVVAAVVVFGAAPKAAPANPLEEAVVVEQDVARRAIAGAMAVIRADAVEIVSVTGIASASMRRGRSLRRRWRD